MRDEIENNSGPQHVHSTNGAESIIEGAIVQIFYTTGLRPTFDFRFSR
jgi:hypothetical protein